jgi:hypothetical protein
MSEAPDPRDELPLVAIYADESCLGNGERGTTLVARRE